MKVKKKSKKSKATDDGLIGFDEPPKTRTKDVKWWEQLPMIEEPAPGVEKELRPVGGFYEIYMHWVKFKNKEGKLKGFFIICPDYVREERRFRQGSKKKCPICLHFRGSHLPDYLNMFGSYKYYFDAFDVTAIEDDDNARTFGVVQVGKYGRKDIVKATKRNKNNVGDPASGSTVFWERDRDEEDPKDREGFTLGRKKKVLLKSIKGKKVYVYKFKDADGSVRKYKGVATDFSSIVKGETPEEIRETLERLGLWDELAKVAEVEDSEDVTKSKKIGSGKKSKSKKKDKERDSSEKSKKKSKKSKKEKATSEKKSKKKKSKKK